MRSRSNKDLNAEPDPGKQTECGSGSGSKTLVIAGTGSRSSGMIEKSSQFLFDPFNIVHLCLTHLIRVVFRIST
jgi:hypothetical protein